MVEAEELAQLRLLNLELLRQLWVGQDAVRRSVARAASESSLESSSSYNSETPSTPETSSTSLSTSCPRGRWSVWGPPDACQGDLRDVARSGIASLPPAKCQHQESLGRPRPHSAPLLGTSSLRDPEPSGRLGDPGPQKAQALRSILAQQSKLSKPRVTFSEESAVPERSWRLRPYLGYDWIAGSLDTSSSITSQPEAFFSKLQEFRETNKEECICSHPEPQFLGLRESSGSGVEEDHECMYCYRVNRRLFLVPVDPGTPCRLCKTPRDQQGPGTLAKPAQVRVSIPLSILEPPHRYHIHRRKSFDASDTLALPRHCLLGWDIFPPKSEKSSAPRNLDLWSSVSAEAQHQKLSGTSSPFHLASPVQVPPLTPTWSVPQVPRPHVPWQKP
ncbi:migration and invasion-inhibitory protein isoform X1 [Pongo pygmaeus]|uniref:migration and invasion-inhibitory protein isoform X1 n=1 Tax=Pongo pygmaeus TaxID=9600 RepID=UPI0023E099FF|nr:migration and invasion-inhibitory protein isoform X1 [Pongo pygmaeus]XP_054294698.1 migration and invasion-inhibitory protein isoform X1 [Pongo pygmaeus]XP_054294708.1 migration and invasion-inhibitory protein isoform X1 [Pongo pygmaeus]